jgi:hypothetical protein
VREGSRMNQRGNTDRDPKHATILTGARYWDRIKQNTKKSEDVLWEGEPDNEDERGDETDAFLYSVHKSSPTQDRDQEPRERTNEVKRF